MKYIRTIYIRCQLHHMQHMRPCHVLPTRPRHVRPTRPRHVRPMCPSHMRNMRPSHMHHMRPSHVRPMRPSYMHHMRPGHMRTMRPNRSCRLFGHIMVMIQELLHTWRTCDWTPFIIYRAHYLVARTPPRTRSTRTASPVSIPVALTIYRGRLCTKTHTSATCKTTTSVQQ
jgi:hypothetical protein